MDIGYDVKVKAPCPKCGKGKLVQDSDAALLYCGACFNYFQKPVDAAKAEVKV
jgi:hypothetical protein